MARQKSSTATAQDAEFQPLFTLRKPQEGLLDLLESQVGHVLAAGSSRVGKSWLYMVYILLLSVEYPGSRHGIFRRNRNACDANLFKLTLFQAINALGMSGYLAKGINKADLTVTFPNGSVITFNGLDENNRDRILGSEFQTIWMNEVSEFLYQDVEFLKGRLYGTIPHKETGAPLKRRMLFDCNPDTFDDWDYKLFVLGIHPLTNEKLQAPEEYAYHRLITDDEEYIKQNIDQTPEWKERFIYANWQASNPNALFPRKYIVDAKHHEDLPRLTNIVVGVDPAVTTGENSDITGIVVAGLGTDGNAYVLADRSVKSNNWELDVLKAYKDFDADEIIAEGNQGGDLVTKVIHQANKGTGDLISVNRVHARKNKEMRAKPIADKYREQRVKHVAYQSNSAGPKLGGNGDKLPNSLSELETQMCAFGGAAQKGKSPDRMDALVWALWRLFQIENTSGPTRVVAIEQDDFWR